MKGMLAAGVLSCLLTLVQNTLVFCHTSDDLADYAGHAIDSQPDYAGTTQLKGV